MSNVDNQEVTHKFHRELDILYITKEKVYTILHIYCPGFLVFTIVLPTICTVSKRSTHVLVSMIVLQYSDPNYNYLYPDSNYLGLYLLYGYSCGEGVGGSCSTKIAIYKLPCKKILDSWAVI